MIHYTGDYCRLVPPLSVCPEPLALQQSYIIIIIITAAIAVSSALALHCLHCCGRQGPVGICKNRGASEEE